VTRILNHPAPVRPAREAAPQRLRVLVSAYAVSPDQGSEPGVGWNVCSRLASYHDVTVLCAPGCPGDDAEVFRREIEAHLRKHGPVPGLSFHFVPHPPLSRLFQRETGLRRRTAYYVGYAAWQRAAFRAAAALHAGRPFDLTHHLNITGYREPGHLWRLDAPFVWGPVGGAADVPAPFLPLMSRADRCFYRVRNLGNALQKRFQSRCRRAARAAAHVWAIGEENRRMIRDWGRDAEAVIESGTTPAPGASAGGYANGRPLRVVWSGNHIGRKALPILLHAMKRLPADGVRCTVLGGGAETARWKRMAEELGIAERVLWTGELPRAAALEHVGGADVMAFTSVQEGTPHAVLEALSLGVPVVCHDACGMGVAVNEGCGIKIAMQSPAASIAGFAEALRRCREEPGLVHRLSDGALRRARELTWDHLAARIAGVYGRCGVRCERTTNRG
jgi:glycosyltransferase involved in cell wall biosynthesis